MMTLDQERNEQLVEQIARQISRWRMAVPSLPGPLVSLPVKVCFCVSR